MIWSERTPPQPRAAQPSHLATVAAVATVVVILASGTAAAAASTRPSVGWRLAVTSVAPGNAAHWSRPAVPAGDAGPAVATAPTRPRRLGGVVGARAAVSSVGPIGTRRSVSPGCAVTAVAGKHSTSHNRHRSRPAGTQ